jgi:hypothetical protein
MFGIGGGGFNIGSLVSTAALAVATGGTSLAVSVALKSLMTQIGSAVIQQVGQQLGLPQAVIDVAQGAFHAATGDFAGAASNLSEASEQLASAVGGGAFEAGEIERQANDVVRQLTENTLKRAREGEGGAESGGAEGKKSFLVRLAEALGKIVDSKMERAIELGEKIDKAQDSKKPKVASLSAEMQAVGQEIGFITQALNTVIKSIGESASTLARKQG